MLVHVILYMFLEIEHSSPLGTEQHAKVSLIVLAINIVWLLPIAFLVADNQIPGTTGVVIAYVPLLIAALILGAGKDSATN